LAIVFAAICLAFRGNAVREIGVARVDCRAHEMYTRRVGVDALAINVGVGTGIIVIGVCTDSCGLNV
jgi:hypothetical protein